MLSLPYFQGGEIVLVIFLMILVSSWLVALFSIRWSSWRMGYPTAMFGILGSFVLDEMFSQNGFWHYSSHLLPGLWPNLTLNLGLYFVGTWAFNQHYPQKRRNVILWYAFGEFILLFVELTLDLHHNMHYNFGWNIGYSAIANILLLLLLRWHFLRVEQRPAATTHLSSIKAYSEHD